MQLMVICSYCGKFIRFKDTGTKIIPKIPITHGICDDCKKIVEKEIEDIKGDDYETQYQTRSAYTLRDSGFSI